MIRLRHILFFLLLQLPLVLQAQDEPDILLKGMLDSAALSQQKVYRNLTDALANPDSVYRLDLSRQKRKEIPEQIRSLKNLQELRLAHNSLREVPAWIGELIHLQKLDLGYNKIVVIPDELGSCREMLFLGLNRNLIETLPKTIGQLEKLKVIEMWDNEVQFLPEEIKYLHNLQVFELRGILFSEQEQEQIRSLLPETDIYFSPSCNCKN